MQTISLVTILVTLAMLCCATRTRAATSDSNGITRNILLPPSPGNPRNSEGAFIKLKDGQILFIYTHFTGGAADDAKAHLAGRRSSDGGLTWTAKDEPIPTLSAKQNVMSVSLLRLRDRRIALFYLVKDSDSSCRLWMHTSSDEAASWSKPILCTTEEGYFVVNNDRVIQLASGRLIVPAAAHSPAPGKAFVARSTSTCFLSDDNGATWRPARTRLTAPAASKSGLQEPGVVELSPDKLLMLMRTDQGCQFQSTSEDGGETWSPAIRSNISSPLSPASIKKIPSTGDLLLVWNDHSNIAPALKSRRTPFTAAVSKDGGKTWSRPLVIESDPDGWYCYTAIEFADGRVLLGHCAGKRQTGGLNTTQITSFPVSLLYR